jgi:DNA-binding NtrC family response regulator
VAQASEVERLGRDKKNSGGDALAALARCHRPGNMRELRNLIEQMTVVTSGPPDRNQRSGTACH